MLVLLFITPVFEHLQVACSESRHEAVIAACRGLPQPAAVPRGPQAPHTVVVHVDAAIYFANVKWIRGRIDNYVNRADDECALVPIYIVVLDTAQEPDTDSTGGRFIRSCHAMKC
jgi:hypothetical protein